MKKQLSLILAAVMLCCSVFSSGIMGMASTNIDEALIAEENKEYTLQTTYDSSENYQTAHFWVRFTAPRTGSYAINTVCSNEDVVPMPIVFPTKTSAAAFDTEKMIDNDGMLFSDDFNILGAVYTLTANATYYIDVVAVNFENENDEPVINFSITTHTHTYEDFLYPATTDLPGSYGKMCSVCLAEKSNKEIKQIKTIKLSKTSYVYDGKAKKPTVTVKDSGGKALKSGTDYTIKYAKGRTKVGRYNVTIKFKGKYEGTVVKTFDIKPKSTSITSLTGSKRAFTVKWKKVKDVSGYQIQYSRYKDFTNADTTTVKGTKTSSKKIGDRLAKKTYYVRVRTYKTVKVNGKSTKIYSGWSKYKTVKTTK